MLTSVNEYFWIWIWIFEHLWLHLWNYWYEMPVLFPPLINVLYSIWFQRCPGVWTLHIVVLGRLVRAVPNIQRATHALILSTMTSARDGRHHKRASVHGYITASQTPTSKDPTQFNSIPTSCLSPWFQIRFWNEAKYQSSLRMGGWRKWPPQAMSASSILDRCWQASSQYQTGHERLFEVSANNRRNQSINIIARLHSQNECVVGKKIWSTRVSIVWNDIILASRLPPAVKQGQV